MQLHEQTLIAISFNLSVRFPTSHVQLKRPWRLNSRAQLQLAITCTALKAARNADNRFVGGSVASRASPGAQRNNDAARVGGHRVLELHWPEFNVDYPPIPVHYFHRFLAWA